MGATERPLAGRVALVTGGNHGIGTATAVALAQQGAAVLVSYLAIAETGVDDRLPQTYARSRARDAEWVLGEIRAAGGRAEAAEADLTDPAAPARLFDPTARRRRHSRATRCRRRRSWGSVGQPDDVAGVIAMLCGDVTGRVTGNVVRMR